MGKHTVRNKDFLIKFGNRLRELRESKNMTQEDLAYRSGLAVSSIGRCETGNLNITISTLEALSRGLEISAKEFFD